MFIVYDKDMNIKPFPKGIRPLDIFIGSIQKNASIDSVEGRNGRIPRGKTYGSRPIEISVGLLPYDTKDYRLLRDEAYAFFDDDVFYISEEYQKGKRYKVTSTSSYTPDRLARTLAQVQIPLEMEDLPFAESIGTTQDIQRYGINATSELWGFGMGLIAEDDALKYTHAGTTFRIYNAGNVPIHPYEQKLNIKVINAFNSTEYLEIINKTNGNMFRLNEGLSNTSVLEINGPNVTINGLQAYRETNRKFIQLEPGWNEFEIKGVSSARIEFDFPFYYK